jgi:hypothetical protein
MFYEKLMIPIPILGDSSKSWVLKVSLLSINNNGENGVLVVTTSIDTIARRCWVLRVILSVPLRMATFLGFALSLLSLLVALGYLIAKLLFWDYFPLGTAPIMVGLFLLASVQLFFIGIIGEYIGLMHMRILKRPLVVERERINFE